MYKNQLQELAQRSCFNLPSYACVREGPDHAPRFRASVNFNGEVFVGPSQCTTLRQAEHAAAEVALTNLSSRVPSRSLAARVLDETGVYKNLLQETTHRAGLKLPIYTTVRSGPGHQPVFTSTVELAGMCVTGDYAKTKKQAEKNAAMAAWSSLKQMPDLEPLPRQKDDGEGAGREEQEQLVRYLSKFKSKEDNKQGMHYWQQMQKQGKKMGVCLNEGTSSSYSSPYSSLPRFQHQWRSIEQLPELSLTNPSNKQQKESSFLTPQILSSLLFTLSSPISSKEKYNGALFQPNSQDTSKKIPTLNLERVKEMTNVQAKPPSFLHRFTDQNSSIFSSREFNPLPRPNIPIEATQRKNSSSIPFPRMLSTGGFQTRGIAPAVQIRSVIPVNAAPPPIRRPPPPAGNHPVDISVKEKVDDFTTTSKLSSLEL